MPPSKRPPGHRAGLPRARLLTAALLKAGLLGLAGTSSVAQTVAPGLAAAGASGAGLTPSATPLGAGQVLLGYDTAVPGLGVEPRGHNIGLAVGVLPGLELSGRLATNDLNCNLYEIGSQPCRRPVRRDLSASFKAGRRWALASWPGWSMAASVGVTDLGGAATHNRSAYGVLGLDNGPWALSAGWARSVSTTAALAGGFASLQWRATDWAQLQAEHLDGRQWLGLRLTLPARWQDSTVQPWLGMQHSLQASPLTPRQWWSAGIHLALGHPGSAARRAGGTGPGRATVTGDDSVRSVPGADISRPAATAGSSAGRDNGTHADASADTSAVSSGTAGTTANPTTAKPPSASAPGTARAGGLPAEPASAPTCDAWAQTLAKRLAAAGFSDIHIGRGRTGLVVDADLTAYAWNNLDALGVALGLVSASPAPAPGRVDLRLRLRGIVVLRALGDTACIADWLNERHECSGDTAPRLLAGAPAQAGLSSDLADDWWLRHQNPSFSRPRLLLAPDIDSRVGTEYGTLDTSAGLGLTLQLPLWRGAMADMAYVQALGHSADYSLGGPFADFRIDSQFYRVMLHQAVDIAPGLAGRVAVGRLFKQLEGGLAELRWQPGDGTHRLSLELARFNHREVDFHKQSAMASYRYFAVPQQTALELIGGRFWHGDRGAMGVVRHWFGDVSVAIYLRRSRFQPDAPTLYSPYGSHFVNAAGVEFAFPLTPRRDTAIGPLQLRGADRFSYGVQSVVGQKTTNYLTPWFGRFAPVPMGLGATVDNADRGGQAYLDSNLARVREAWRSLSP